MSILENLQRYGVAPPLASKVKAAELSLTKIRALSKNDLVKLFLFSPQEASELKKCVSRQPIDAEVATSLLSRSNHLCCVCKGDKGVGVVLHHIIEYEKSQDNSYTNLAVLCPNDHDRAHQSGLSLALTVDQVLKAKTSWEHQVEIENVRKAARSIQVVDEAVDYINIQRIEEMCLQRFGKIPRTTITSFMRQKGILGAGDRFDEKFVRDNLSHGSYLFDYVNSHETEHYRELLVKLSETIEFDDLSEAIRSGFRKLSVLEGKYAFFVGGVASKYPQYPILGSQAFEWKYKKGKVEVTWHADAKYFMSSSSISRQGSINRYLIYGLVRTVAKLETGVIQVKCSPLFVAQPREYVDRTPLIAWRKNRYLNFEDDEVDEDILTEDN